MKTNQIKGVYEVRDLFDNRWGIFKDGICVGVVNSQEELTKWFALRRKDPYIHLDLDSALKRMK